ncbi:MAG: ABC transporter permease [Oscillospiraceae bacterium]|nr:ABC transporter permease [Oscillospiraceae bacterium]
MKHFWVLLKVSVKSMLLTSTGRDKGKRKRAASGMRMALLMAFLGVYLSGLYSNMLLDVLIPIRMEVLLFIYMGIGALVGGLLYTVFAVKGVVFGGKDNDLLLALPVSSTVLMASRMAAIYLESLIMSFFVLVPAGVICAVRTGMGLNVSFFLRLLLATLLLPLLDTALSVLIGALLAFASARVTRGRNWGQNIFMALFLIVVFYFSFNLQGILNNLALHADSIKEGLRWAMPLVWMADGIMGSWQAVGLFALCCVIPCAVVTAGLGRCYRWAVTAFHARSARSDYKLTGQRSAGQTKALLAKEKRRFFGTPGYLWNAGLGLMLLLVMGVAAIVKREALRELSAVMPALPVAAAAMGFCLSTCIITAPSVSLEGRCFWILREAPLAAERIIGVKIAFQLLLAVPCVLISGGCLAFALSLPLWQGIVLIVTMILFAVGCACFGMLMGLCFPKLDAANETLVIKQSMASVLAMFIPMAALGAAGLLYAFVHMWAAVALVAVLAVACAVVVKQRGAGMLERL